MSSPKDYLLEIDTSSQSNSIKFTVRCKPSFFLRYLRLPMVGLLLAFIAPKVKEMTEVSRNREAWTEIMKIWHCESILSSENTALWQSLRVPAMVIGTLCIIIVLLTLQQASDSLIILQDMGVQLNSKSNWRLGSSNRSGKFIPLSEIIDIVIHEGFQGYGQVIYYMCILTRDKSCSGTDSNTVKVIFPNFLPRKDILLQVWKLSRQMLYGTTRRHFRHVSGQGLREVQHLHD